MFCVEIDFIAAKMDDLRSSDVHQMCKDLFIFTRPGQRDWAENIHDE